MYTIELTKVINESYFCVRHINRQKHNQNLKAAVFQNKFIICHIKPNIYIKKNKCASYKHYKYKKDSKRPKCTTHFLTFPEKKQPTNMAAAKTFFSSVYVIGPNCFNECLLFYVITGRHYLS